MDRRRDNKLQALCREYLTKLRPFAKKHGLEGFVDETIAANKQDKCKGTEEDCEMLSRMVEEERLKRTDIPKVMGKSYRKCDEDGDFDSKEIKKLPHVGIYSKVSVLLYEATHKKEK